MRHVKIIHAKVKDFKCTECGKEFVDKRNLKDHEKKFHPSQGVMREHKCDVCKKNYLTHATYL